MFFNYIISIEQFVKKKEGPGLIAMFEKNLKKLNPGYY